MRFSRSSKAARRVLWASALLSIVAAVNPGGAAQAAGGDPLYTPPIALNGTASLMWRAGDDARVLRLTDGSYRQAGSAWSTQRVDLTGSFETTFTAHVRNGQAGADGIAFLVQGAGPRALGGWGGGLGYRGIAQSVAVEFDTYQNTSDPSSNHLAVVLGGNPDQHASSAESPMPLYGKPFHARVRYDADSRKLTVFVGSTSTGGTEQLVLEQEVDLVARTGVTSGWVGFTGGTGDLAARQDVYEWSVGAPQD